MFVINISQGSQYLYVTYYFSCNIIIFGFIQQATSQQNLPEPTDPQLTRLHRDGTCPFFAAAQKAKALSNNERVIKLEDGTDIPLDDAFEIFRSISFDDTMDGKYYEFFFYIFIFYILIIVL